MTRYNNPKSSATDEDSSRTLFGIRGELNKIFPEVPRQRAGFDQTELQLVGSLQIKNTGNPVGVPLDQEGLKAGAPGLSVTKPGWDWGPSAKDVRIFSWQFWPKVRAKLARSSPKLMRAGTFSRCSQAQERR